LRVRGDFLNVTALYKSTIGVYFTYNLQQLQVSSNDMIPLERETEKNDQCRYTIISDNGGAIAMLSCLSVCL